MTTERERRFVGPRRGQLIFALAFVALSALLLSMITQQTAWLPKTKLSAQPRFWPAIGLGGMTLLGALHLIRLPWRRLTPADWTELRRWGGILEFALWFMGYVLIVPVLGYLPVTLAFVLALTWRMGYRDRKMYLYAALFGLVVVVGFKGLLNVRIPGGAVYDYLPDPLRGLFILYL